MSHVLALNCGSSSLKYAVFAREECVFRGEVQRIGAGGLADHEAAVHAALDAVTERGLGPLLAVGHRIVHGGPSYSLPTRVDAALIVALEGVVPFAPLHLPIELAAIAAVRTHHGAGLPQVACFDTGFHHTLAEVARRFPLPVALHEAGIRRYGFHGLSYENVVDTLGAARLDRAVVAHLGNGASMVALRDGRSIDTTMAFTPAAGIVMGTRSGDLDPGLSVYLLEHRGYDARSLGRLVTHEAGLFALSGGTSDMRTLLELRGGDPRAALAVEAFCYQARKSIGALAAVLGGIDSLVFTGGIGEHAAVVRREICAGLEFLGIELDNPHARCRVHVVACDEERIVARSTRDVLGLDAAA